MSLTIEQTDAAIRNTFYNMEEGIEYVLNDFWFSEANRIRKENNHSPLKSREEYKFFRRTDKLFVNGKFVFHFDGRDNIAVSFALAYAASVALSLTFSFALAFTLAFILPFALQHNGLEKLNNCDGKIVEIDGKKYKLTAV